MENHVVPSSAQVWEYSYDSDNAPTYTQTHWAQQFTSNVEREERHYVREREGNKDRWKERGERWKIMKLNNDATRK